MNLELFSAEEHDRVTGAGAKYGAPWIHARAVTDLLSNLMQWPIVDCDLFIRFYSQVKKFHSLSIVSTVRLHRVQAKMCLRYFAESVVHAVYCLDNVNSQNYFDHENNKLADAKKAAGIAYKWLEERYPAHSDFLRGLKADINEQTAHAHVVNTGHNFDVVRDPELAIVTSYFDFEHDHMVKLDLWLAAKAGIEVIGLILQAQKDFGVFIPTRADERVPGLIVESDAILEAIRMANR